MKSKSVNSPRWYVSPVEQIDWVTSLIDRRGLLEFKVEDIPSIPEAYDLDEAKPTEVLMLAVYLPDKGQIPGLMRTFQMFVDELLVESEKTEWEFDYSEFKNIRQNLNRIRLFNEAEFKPGIRWVVYDPDAYTGMSTKFVRDLHLEYTHHKLAGVEVLQSALIFPELRRVWCSRTKAAWRRDVTPAPYLAGIDVDSYSFKEGGYLNTWDYVPVFTREVRRIGPLDANRKLALKSVPCISLPSWHSLPTVRDF